MATSSTKRPIVEILAATVITTFNDISRQYTNELISVLPEETHDIVEKTYSTFFQEALSIKGKSMARKRSQSFSSYYITDYLNAKNLERKKANIDKSRINYKDSEKGQFFLKEYNALKKNNKKINTKDAYDIVKQKWIDEYNVDDSDNDDNQEDEDEDEEEEEPIEKEVKTPNKGKKSLVSRPVELTPNNKKKDSSKKKNSSVKRDSSDNEEGSSNTAGLFG